MMDNTKHLYTVLAITAFLALPFVMDNQHGAVDAHTIGFSVPDFSRLGSPGERTRSQPQARSAPSGAASPVPMEPAHAADASETIQIKQRWIDDPRSPGCRQSGSSEVTHVQPGTVPARCLIV